MKLSTFQFGMTSLLMVGLSGCGGGGGGGGGSSGPVASTLSFPLQSAYKALVASGRSKSLTVSITAVSGTTVSGPCSGTGSVVVAPATTPATFEGKPALSAVTTLTLTMSASPGCNAVTTATTSTAYYDSNYAALGSNVVGGDYGVFLTPLSVPASVKVGDTGIVGTETLYTNSTKATGKGTSTLSYLIEPDTSTTAIADLIATTSDAAGKLAATEQDRYQLTAVGALTPISADALLANGSTVKIQYF